MIKGFKDQGMIPYLTISSFARLLSGVELKKITGNEKRGKEAGYVRKAQQRGIPSRVKRD